MTARSWTDVWAASVKQARHEATNTGLRLWNGLGQAKARMLQPTLFASALTVDSVATHLHLDPLAPLDMDCQFLQMVDAMTDAELAERLSQFGICTPPSSAATRNIVVQILFNVKEDAFWRIHYSIHPNAHRVRPWLAKHQCVRDMLLRVELMVAELKGALDDSDRMLRNIEKSFLELDATVRQHKAMEGSYLFQPMSTHLTHDIDGMDHLLHASMDRYYPERIIECLDRLLHADGAVGTSNADCASLDHVTEKERVHALEEYVAIYFRNLEAEMLQEETTIVVRWLNLPHHAHQIIASTLPPDAAVHVYPRRRPWS
ncbi:Aste57867_13383 [Aphanomyces stellatus]|uniref:Aste57867_13383 protein n=1 Tax=Aphanomyces stellatus TaxID=120398 RepID=A0A485KY81_9STRA|nr:hypothetical protein As57867_013333 [Aphanomyces stellatus]VFT90222.1 Aste57867_13383 [Aphanomyces stellatus]